MVIAAQTTHFYQNQYDWMSRAPTEGAKYRIALDARRLTPPNGSLLVFGDDWSSVIPYYAQRKALMISDKTPLTILRDVLRDPMSQLAGTSFAGIVDCWGGSTEPRLKDEAIAEAILAGRAIVATEERCRLLSAER